MTIEEIKISPSTYQQIVKFLIVGKLIQYSACELKRIPNFGEKSLNEVIMILRARRILLKTSLAPWELDIINEKNKEESNDG